MYKDGGEECLSKRTTGGSRKGEEYLKREEKVITGSRKWGWGGGGGSESEKWRTRRNICKEGKETNGQRKREEKESEGRSV